MKKSKFYEQVTSKLFIPFFVMGPSLNLISCVILALVIRHVHRLTKKVETGSETVVAKRKMNTLVTISHIGVTFAFTITEILVIFSEAFSNRRIFSAFYFFGALADLMLSLMLWFIIDDNKAVAVVMDGDRVYAVIDVIKPHHSGINE